MIHADVPSPIDLKQMDAAREWERTAMQRPFRMDFLHAFADELRALPWAALQVLELGSGPGFLAQHLLLQLPDVQLTLLDFSAAMHTLAQQRLAADASRVTFVERSFKAPDWNAGLGSFNAVLALQSVHELRHKQYATALHQQVRSLLRAGGVYLVCDHFCGEGGMSNDQLYMSLAEQRASLEAAGYEVAAVLIKGGRALYRAFAT